MKKLLMMMVLGAMVAAANCWADEENEGTESKIEFKELPAAVQQAALKFYKLEDVREIELETEGNTAQYGVEGVSNGEKMDLTFAADGTLMRTVVKVDFASLPKLAQEALLKEYPDGEIKEVEKVVETSYDVELVAAGQKHEIEVKASGDIEDMDDNDVEMENEDKDED
jgi:hypothetical protein